jgi:hypothetical protein
MDIETTFLNTKTDMDIYVELSPKWKAAGITDNKVVLLFQALYGLK